ncbi:hypothetical protein BH18THE2_BH18THE2_34670 [soil metagenome]
MSVVYSGMQKRLKPFDIRMLSIIGESRVPLPANEIRKKMIKHDPGSDWRFVYQKLKELTPTTDVIRGMRLFCYDDFVANTHNEVNKKLVKKLEAAYGYGLEWKWDKIQPYFEINACGNKVIKIRNDDKNFIEIELLPTNTEKHRKNLAKMVLVINGSKFEPPLITERKNTKWYVYSMSAETYVKGVGFRTYLFYTLSKEGENMVSKKRNQIESGDLLSYDEEQVIRHEIEGIKNNRHYWEYSLNLRGLLIYLSGESTDNNRIDKTLESLSERDKYVRISDSVVIGINKNNGQDLFRVWSYQIREDFPFLSHYNELKKSVPEKFSAKLLKDIALELQYRIENINNEDLKYEVTSRYYNGITNHFWLVGFYFTPLILDRNRVNPETRDIIIKYQLEILAYLNHRKQKEIFRLESERNHYLQYYRS